MARRPTAGVETPAKAATPTRRLSKTAARLTVLRPEEPEGHSDDAAEALAHYDEKWLDCRDLRHMWLKVGYFHAANGDVMRRLRCTRCQGTAVDHWTRTGHRYPRAYDLPDGYSLPGTRLAMVEVRVEVLSRATIFDDEQSMVASVMKSRGRVHKAVNGARGR